MAAAIRSTLIVSAIQTLRARGYYDRYVTELGADHREKILALIAGAWLPIEVV